MKFISYFSRISLIIACVAAHLLPGMAPTQAATITLDSGFDPNYILSDDDIFNAKGMTHERLATFLKSKGTLGDKKLPDIDGKEKPIADIIWRVSQTYKINPKYLLVLLQKEQSLIEDPDPSAGQLDWATGYGVCDSCAKDDPNIQDFKGFAAQLEWAAKQHREKYLIQLLSKGITIGGHGVGKNVTIDGMSVTPVNQATAMLYSYTPHLHGNLNLWRIWQRWFSVSYPDDTVVRGTPSKKIYVIRFGEKRAFASAAVASSMIDATKIVEASDNELQRYPDGSVIKFAPYSLLRSPTGAIYLLTKDAKRHITSMEAFKKFAFNEEEVENVTEEDLASYPNGESITVATSFPQGVLMKTADAKGVWYVEDGVRRPLIDGVLLKLYFKGRAIKTVTEKTLVANTEGSPYTLQDGELVKGASSPAVYVVEHGVLRPIPSGEIFESVGWKWKNVITVPDKLLSLHPTGDAFSPFVHSELAANITP